MRKAAARRRFGGLAMGAVIAATAAGTGAATLEEGYAAYDAGDVEGAYDTFSALFHEQPGDEAVNFALGLAAERKGKLGHAAFAFERVLRMDPDNQRARLELGRTYFAMGRNEAARVAFKQVLEAAPPERVRRNVQRFLDEIARRTSRTTVQAVVELAGFRDDNVNYGPSSARVDTRLGPLQVASSSRPEETWGLSLAGGLGLRRELGEPGGWSATAQLSAYQSLLERATQQEVLYVRAGGGVRRQTEHAVLEWPLYVDVLEYGHEDLLRAYGTEPAWTGLDRYPWLWTGYLRLEYRDYQDTDERDAPYARFGGVVRRVLGTRGDQLNAGLFGFVEAADASGYANRGLEATLGGERHLLHWLSVYANLGYRHIRYRGALYPELQDGARRDNEWTLAGGLRVAPGRTWGVDAGYRRVDNRSNFDLFAYERNVFTVSTWWSY